MKRCLSIVLSIVMLVSVMGFSGGMERIYAANYKYDTRYGIEIYYSSDDYAIAVYNKLFSEYVFQDGDAANTNGRYTGLAQPLTNEGVIEISFSGIAFGTDTNSYDKGVEVVNEYVTAESRQVLKSALEAFDAFKMDYPEVFWLKGMSVSVSADINLWYYTGRIDSVFTLKITLTPKQYFDGASDYIEAFNKAVVTAKENIIAKFDVNGTTRLEEKVMYVHDYVASQTDYNYEVAELVTSSGNVSDCFAFTPAAVFLDNAGIDEKVVCEGYAKAFKILCDQCGIISAIVEGVAVNATGNSENHMWNTVQMDDGKWYAVDVTWDDQSIGILHTYMLVGKNSKGFYDYFKNDHVADNTFSTSADAKEFAIPEIANKTYSFAKLDFSNESTNITVNTTTNATSSSTTNTSTNNANTSKKYKWTISGIKDATYTGKAITQKLTIKCNGKTLKNGKDYKVTYKNNTKVGKATVVITPIGGYKGISPVKYSFNIKKTAIKEASFGKVKAVKYKGKAVKPVVKVRFAGKKLVSGKDYTVTYKNNKKKGTAKIVIKGKGSFKGKKVIKFKIK